MKKIADWIVRYRIALLVLFLLAAAAGGIWMGKTTINYDMSKYLPADSPARQGMDQMSETFGDSCSLDVMFSGLADADKAEIRAQLEAVEGVSAVQNSGDGRVWEQDGNDLFVVTLDSGAYSREASRTVQRIRDRFADSDVSIAGVTVDNDLTVSALVAELPMICAVAFVLILAILLVMCATWIEPLVYLGNIAVSVLIAMGTNALLPQVSFMTFAVAPLLQVALSMDYSVMLMDRYRQELERTEVRTEAMSRALRGAFLAISGSSVTTIAGLLVLLCMSFTIGRDMGIVLAKAVLTSLLCTFTVLPALLLLSGGLMKKTGKWSLRPRAAGLARAQYRGRWAFAAAAVLILVGCFALKNGVPVTFQQKYDSAERDRVQSAFGVDNQLVVLYGADADAGAQAELAYWLAAQDGVTSVTYAGNTVDLPRSASELAEFVNADPAETTLLFQLYAARDTDDSADTLTVWELTDFLTGSTFADSPCAALADPAALEAARSAKAQLDAARPQFETLYTSTELAAALQMDAAAAAQLFALHGQSAGGTEKMTVYDFVVFVCDGVLADSRSASLLPAAQAEQLTAVRSQLESAHTALYAKQNAAGLAAALGMDESAVKRLLHLRTVLGEDVSALRMTPDAFLTFLTDDILADSAYAPLLTDDMRAAAENGRAELETARAQLETGGRARMIADTTLPGESEGTFRFISALREKAAALLGDDARIVGDSAVASEMNDSFSGEMRLITLLTIAVIFAVVAAAFRSLSVPVLLVAMIQGAVFAVMALCRLEGTPLYYVALILVQCILMGATIDYAILLTDHYRLARRDRDVQSSMGAALERSLGTILTSSLILVGVCFTLGIMTSQSMIASVCLTLAQGGLCASLMVVFLLPPILALCDRLVVPKRQRR